MRCYGIGSIDRMRDDRRTRDRRARTNRPVELGDLVQNVGLVELIDDDRATLVGAFLDIDARPQQLRSGRQWDQVGSRADLLMRWRRRGVRAFEAAAEPTARQ
jgi:hypothetical protein